MMFDRRTIRDLLNSGSELTSDESRRLRNLWKETPASLRVEIMGATLDEATIFLLQEGALEKEELRLLKLLSLSISLPEAMALQLTNYLSYISHLVRSKGINARSLLNVMTECIKNTEDQLHEEIEKQIEVYRNLEDDNSESERLWGDTGQVELEEEGDYKYEEVTIEASKTVNQQGQTVGQQERRVISFSWKANH